MTQERSWVIGSAADCDVVVKDPKVSRRHCRLTQKGQQFILEDLDSTNGTFVNGQRVRSKLVVTTADEITLGRRVMLPWPDDVEKVLPVVIRVGRDVNNDVIIELPTVSGHHARITVENGVITLEDLRSTNGTAVGTPDNKIQSQTITRQDCIYLGSLSVPASLLLDKRGNITKLVSAGVQGGIGTEHGPTDDDIKPGQLQTREDIPEERPSTKVKKTVADSDSKDSRSPLLEEVRSPNVPSGVAKIRDKLLDLQIVSPAEWKKAVEEAGGDSDIAQLLYQLRQMKAGWRIGAGDDLRVLSDYQQQKILADEIEDLRLDDYIILDRVGGGGMGEVFKARNLKLSRLEAIKTIATDGLQGSMHSDAKQRFRREARILAALSHPNISTVYDSGYSGDTAYIAMEYITGKDMKALVEETMDDGEMVPIGWAIEQIIKVAEALHKAHELKVIHRDIKPGNIMITDNGELKVLDMGIARIKDPSSGIGGSSIITITNATSGLGTPEVMPPEQWRDATSVSPASDIYSLGCTFFYMLTGEMPFMADNLGNLMLAHAKEKPRSVCEFRDDCPRYLDQVIQKMLAKDPADRYPSAVELIEALKQAPTETYPRWVIPTVVVVVLVAAATAAFVIW